MSNKYVYFPHCKLQATTCVLFVCAQMSFFSCAKLTIDGYNIIILYARKMNIKILDQFYVPLNNRFYPVSPLLI